ncbi:hypothetical protein AVEN_192472-1 [Araneus ventricosus]|uniref:Uncharacterized protein n=1 Tax=Araneus ventricosus TaxID=182803 RepID=A0A4Y2M3P8_ARAVE|nr:hypothetical protein AVEN_192472-1 [Araneus ventricosus]
MHMKRRVGELKRWIVTINDGIPGFELLSIFGCSILAGWGERIILKNAENRGAVVCGRLHEMRHDEERKISLANSANQAPLG